MKFKLLILSLLATPALASAAEEQGGTLGVDSVRAYSIYETYLIHSKSVDDIGGGLALNQHLFGSDTWGVDAGLGAEFMKNRTDDASNYFRYRSGMAALTVYRNGTLAPFASVTIMRRTYSDASDSNVSEDLLGLKLGVEWHVTPEWYVKPSVASGVRLDGGDAPDSVETRYSVETGYWFSRCVGAFANANYYDNKNYQEKWVNVGVMVRY